MVKKEPVLAFLMTVTFFSTAQGGKDVHAGMGHAAMGHAHEGGTKTKTPEASIKLSVVKIEDKGDKQNVQIKLSKIKDNSPLSIDNLKEVHKEKIHLLIIDNSLEDYTHVHPKATADEGVYEFEWRPTKRNANYRIWADIIPFDTNVQEYALTDLTISNETKAEINRTESMVSTVDGLTFKLTFDNGDLQAGKSTMGKIMIVDDKGNPVHSLEPIMGSFAHIVGFGDDFKSIVHIHPMGIEPTEDTERGGPELQFHLEPENTEFIKLFVQVKVHGKELFAPFKLVVKGSM